jgi:poly(A) polymerase
MQPPSSRPLASAPWLTAPAGQKLLNALTAKGHETRFVGGCVRDGLLGRFDPESDIDLATPALPDQIIDLLEAAGIKAIPTGIAHGTITAICEGRPFEITTLREDIGCDGRHADVRFSDDFKLDAARRDFTINAMSADRQGQLFDYFGGRADLDAGLVRFVGVAAHRVEEDFLRILRFFRFFARYGCPPADPEALAACRQGASGIDKLSGERIRTEMLKLLATKDPVPSLHLMIDNNILEHILPSTPDLTVLARLITLAPDSDSILRLAALLRSTTDPTPAKAVATAWRMSKVEAARLERLTSTPLLTLPASSKATKRDLYRLGRDGYVDLLRLSATTPEALQASLRLPRIGTMPVTGDDLIERGVPPGPELGELLIQIEDWWLDHDMQPDRALCLAELDRRLSKSRA